MRNISQHWEPGARQPSGNPSKGGQANGPGQCPALLPCAGNHYLQHSTWPWVWWPAILPCAHNHHFLVPGQWVWWPALLNCAGNHFWLVLDCCTNINWLVLILNGLYTSRLLIYTNWYRSWPEWYIITNVVREAPVGKRCCSNGICTIFHHSIIPSRKKFDHNNCQKYPLPKSKLLF